jgi:hypothetical protein
VIYLGTGKTHESKGFIAVMGYSNDTKIAGNYVEQLQLATLATSKWRITGAYKSNQ